MATLTLNFPDQQAQRIIDAMAHDAGWSSESGENKNQAAKRGAAEAIKRRVVEVENNIARATYQPPLPPDIT